ncbi:MAG TPA: dTDP-4-dehydrorhamnose 3,5-epimerase family protein [Bryobacteraceae bacterium]|nr:dTDP-4-dehydrorhamnose 3,5-epimerase family protein [Bryobacteraceae bacterium]
MVEPIAVQEPLRVASGQGLELLLPDCPRGIGAVITSPQAADLIEGVKIQPLSLWPDDRGYFLEVQRMGSGLAADFPVESTQVSATVSHRGTIKAFHYHLRQTDCWTPVRGMLQVAMVDLRQGARTFGLRNTIYVGELRPWQILIPPGVGHGYKVVGTSEAMLVYLTNRHYDPKDEGRIAYNDPHINYDWETQHK